MGSFASLFNSKPEGMYSVCVEEIKTKKICDFEGKQKPGVWEAIWVLECGSLGKVQAVWDVCMGLVYDIRPLRGLLERSKILWSF